MFPTLIDLGTVRFPWLGHVHLALPTYGVLFALGALLGGWWFVRRAAGLDVSDEHRYNLVFYSLLWGIVGAKATLVLLDLRYYIEHPLELLGTLRSAGVLLGGVTAGSMAFVVYARRHGLPLFRLGDAVAAPLALAQSIGRLGCFCAGCCWGHATESSNPLAVVFTDPVAHAQTGVPLHVPLVATQLLQAGNDILLALILTALWRKRIRPDGTVFWCYLVLYGLTRSLIEFWRGDLQRGVYFDGLISTSQLIALSGVGVGLLLLLVRRPVGGRPPAP